VRLKVPVNFLQSLHPEGGGGCQPDVSFRVTSGNSATVLAPCKACRKATFNARTCHRTHRLTVASDRTLEERAPCEYSRSVLSCIGCSVSYLSKHACMKQLSSAIAGMLLSILFTCAGCSKEKRISRSTESLIAEFGAPDLISSRAGLVTETVNRLEVAVSIPDPQTFTNWNSLENCVLIWLESPDGRERMRINRDDLLKTGSAYYIARARRETANLYVVTTNGMVNKSVRLRYEAIGLTFSTTNQPASRNSPPELQRNGNNQPGV
jgi:hypothetical protein